MSNLKLIGILFILPLCIARSKYVVMDDMEMTKATYRQFFSTGRVRRASATTRGGYRLWDSKMIEGNWIIPYKMKEGMIDRIQVKILDAMKDFEAVICLKFVEATTEKEFMLFTNDRCSSGVGRTASRTVNIAEGWCERKGTIQHEMMHALGFFHEHQRPDRDLYIKIHHKNIRHGIQINFEKMTHAEVDSNGVDYDYNSIMQYSSTAGANKYGAVTMTKLDGSAITEYQREFMSEGDIKQLNLLYRCPGLDACSDSTNTTHCERKVRQGFCHQKPSHMYRHCRKSCEFCDCKDQTDCSKRSKAKCFDPATMQKMRAECPIMCGYCGKACFDADKEHCVREKARNKGCGVNDYIMSLTCPKTCGYCVDAL